MELSSAAHASTDRPGPRRNRIVPRGNHQVTDVGISCVDSAVGFRAPSLPDQLPAVAGGLALVVA